MFPEVARQAVEVASEPVDLGVVDGPPVGQELPQSDNTAVGVVGNGAGADGGDYAQQEDDDVVGDPEQRVQGGVHGDRLVCAAQAESREQVEHGDDHDVAGAEPLDVVVSLVGGPDADADRDAQYAVQQDAEQPGCVLSEQLAGEAVDVVVEAERSQEGGGEADADAEHQRVHPDHHEAAVLTVLHKIPL